MGELQRGLVAEEGVGQFLDGTETSLARQFRQAAATSRFWAWHTWPRSKTQHLESITHPSIAAVNQP